MDLRQLAYFVAVAEELSFRKAATRVHLTQPPLSRQIAKLERELDAELFVRSAHEVTLTHAGKALLEDARRLLGMAKIVPDNVRRARNGETGVLRIGFVGSTIYTAVPLLLSKFRQSFPHVAVTVQQLTVAKQSVMLINDEIDVGITRQYFRDPRLVTRTLLREGLIVAMPADHRLAGSSHLELASLADDDFIFFSRSEAPVVHDQLISMCEKAGFAPRIVQEASPISTVVGLVGAGVGVALVPESMNRLNVENVVFKALPGAQTETEILLAWSADNQSPTLKGFLDLQA